MQSTNVFFDYDYNLVAERVHTGRTIVYKLNSNTLTNLPSSEMERLVRLIAKDKHQALLVWHAVMQGKQTALALLCTD